MKKYLLIVACVLFTGLVFSSCGRSDIEVLGDVRNAVQITYPSVAIEVRNGIVSLTGAVETDAAKAEAEKVSAEIPGVKRVNNELLVVPPAPKVTPDQMLRTAITRGFEEAKIKGIEISIENEEVTLTGKASNADQKKIMALMKGFKTKKVINKMTR